MMAGGTCWRASAFSSMSERTQQFPPFPGSSPPGRSPISRLELNYAPAHLIVLGAGYIGLELAQAYRRFGSRVTIVEPGSRPMGREDPDVARSSGSSLRKVSSSYARPKPAMCKDARERTSA
jgi:pyruvate/2-oxoglutarate dehydrogenase complex dihydrolipoamide dehydrogenase (E3) component